MADIIHKENYISAEQVSAIKHFFDKKIRDKLSGGPNKADQLEAGLEGCWDRSLHYELKDNPIHEVIDKLIKDFGGFHVHESSIRYMAYPFVPHSDIRNSEWLLAQRQNFYPGYDVKSSGDFHYPKTGYMGWHTNHDNPLERVYITYATEERKSFFRYIENGKMITDYDNKGITVRQFKVTDKPPYFWHCVGSECDRLSFGYTLNKNKNDG
jgi:hypothetical protein